MATKYSAMFQELRNRIDETNASPHVRRLNAETRQLARATEALDLLQEKRNPLDTDAAHFRKVSIAANRLKRETMEAKDRIWNATREGAVDITRRMDERCGLVESPYSSEIRATFRNMDDKERTAVLQKAIDEADGVTMAALTKGPAILSGMTDDAISRNLEKYQSTHAPDLLNEMESLFELEKMTNTALHIASEAVGYFANPSQSASIDAAEAEANQATESFTRAFSAEQ